MFVQIRRPIRFVRRKALLLYEKVITFVYGPSEILDLLSSRRVIVHGCVLGGETYRVVEVVNGQLFTDGRRNISVISRRRLVPFVSWQHDAGQDLKTDENFLLSGRLRLSRRPERIQGTVVSLLCGESGNYNYFHWLFEVLPRLHLLNRLGIDLQSVIYLVPDCSCPFQVDTLNALGIGPERRLTSQKHGYICADLMVAISHPVLRNWDMPDWMLHFVRQSLLPLASKAVPGQFIYISRRDSANSRRLINEEDFCRQLNLCGFHCVVLSELSFADQVTLFSGARMIVGVHGAGLTNLVFASPGTVVYELYLQAYNPPMFANIARWLKLDYHGIACEPTDLDASPQLANLRISACQVEMILAHATEIGCRGEDVNRQPVDGKDSFPSES
ncbi:glycosyltransferase family 61 protein [Synechococcus sp. BA-132 BA5]|uniref:glycosyltransferase family 61 protein n=1 Tax=Synechococcus sp. BA-132 BA5 TaxID=3110252 RepID=UPI002B218730|nr:glycosyltransferase family 61 protein [Synechococcus sp. BA-132 BA5]MEA5417267.1 glycosyltransferase family 61 protein [Synechococcus sp. BA-132 BA5]